MPNITTQTIRVDLNTGREIPTAFVHQNDTARRFIFKVYLNGTSYDMTGHTVKFAYRSPTVNGEHTVISGSSMVSGSVSDNTVTVTLPVAYTLISGVGVLTMIITPTSGTIRPVNIRLVVQKSADGADVIASASDFPTTLNGFTESWLQRIVPATLAHKVDKPISNPNGSNGQLLATKGDGTTEWVNVGQPTNAQTSAAVNAWLNAHPEATTTVQDGSLTEAKFAESLKLKAINPYITPEMFGAKADGVTDDSVAIQSALDAVKNEESDRNSIGFGVVYMAPKKYLITQPLLISDNVHLKCDGHIVYTGTDSAIVHDGRYSFIEISMISAENGTAYEITSSRRTHETISNNIRINRIRPCKRGLYIHDEEMDHAVTTDYIQVDQIDGGWGNGNYGIEINGEDNWLTELHFHIGHVTNFKTGLYVHNAGSLRFHRLHIEGVTDEGMKLFDLSSSYFYNTRLDESFGTNQIVFGGEVVDNVFNLSAALTDRMDTTAVTSARNNLFHAADYKSSYANRYIGYDFIFTDSSTTGKPEFMPIGRTSTVMYGQDTYETVLALYGRGIGVLAIADGVPTVYALSRVNTSSKTAFFTTLYSSASSNSCYFQIWKCQEVDGSTVWSYENERKIQAQDERVTSVLYGSTDEQYPTAKAVWNFGRSIIDEVFDRMRGYSDKDRIASSIDTDGSVYQTNGYIEGYRLHSDGTLGQQSGTITTGFMKYAVGDIFKVWNARWQDGSQTSLYLTFCIYDQDFNFVGSYNNMGNQTGDVVAANSSVTVSNSVITFDIDCTNSNAYYCRLSVFWASADGTPIAKRYMGD